MATAFYATFLPSRGSTRAIGSTDALAGVSSSSAALPTQPDVLGVTIAKQSASASTHASASAALASSAANPAAIPAGMPAPARAEDILHAAGLPAPAAAAAPSPVCDTSVSVLYCVYTIQPDDTLSTIASRFGLKNGEVQASDLLVNSNKPDITSAEDLLQIGQKLRIPSRPGVIHTVLSGDNLSTMASVYDVSIAEIVAVDVNHIGDLNALKIGDEVLVPNPKQFFRPAPALLRSPGGSGSGSDTTAAQVVRGGQASQSGFIWPVGGRISSYFGPSHPLGIDVDLFSTPNAPVGAAAAGTVTFAGGNPCCSYGYYVVISHGNGFETLYAHFSKLSVATGQRVTQGQLLGNAGRTGYATGNHLHFEVHLNGSIVNPLAYLP